jgi:hypothetical protein
LAVGIVVTEIAVRGRRQHTAAARQAGYLDGINAAARAVAADTEPQLLIDQVCGQQPRCWDWRRAGSRTVPPGSGTRPSLEQRLVTVGLADQAAAALADLR